MTVGAEKFGIFARQFQAAKLSAILQVRALLFRGASGCGKSDCAAACYGRLRSLVVNCLGLNETLPSLTEFSRVGYDCIIFDDVTERQVLCNKLVFQSGETPV